MLTSVRSGSRMSGKERRRPIAYGWHGADSTSAVAPASTMRPAYRIAMRSHNFSTTPISCRRDTRCQVGHAQAVRLVTRGALVDACCVQPPCVLQAEMEDVLDPSAQRLAWIEEDRDRPVVSILQDTAERRGPAPRDRFARQHRLPLLAPLRRACLCLRLLARRHGAAGRVGSRRRVPAYRAHSRPRRLALPVGGPIAPAATFPKRLRHMSSYPDWPTIANSHRVRGKMAGLVMRKRGGLTLRAGQTASGSDPLEGTDLPAAEVV